MTPDQVIAEWEKDAPFDDSALDTAALAIPIMHGKYLRLLSKARRERRALEFSHRKVTALLREYYSGHMTAEQLKDFGRPQCQHRYLRVDLDKIVAADPDYIKGDTDLQAAEECVVVLEEILRAINNRGYQIKNAIEWRKLTNFSQI